MYYVNIATIPDKIEPAKDLFIQMVKKLDPARNFGYSQPTIIITK